MLFNLIENIDMETVYFIGILFSIAATFLMLGKFNGFLPKDQGKEFAVGGMASKGKIRGAGISFIIVYCVAVALFSKLNVEICIYTALVFAAMLTGYLDDAAEVPWGRLKKGLLDLFISIATAVTYIYYNGTKILIATANIKVTIPPVIMGILIIILVWAAINVTNCSDGVDGLCGTLCIITLSTIYAMDKVFKIDDGFNYTILLMIIVILVYLWYNAPDSTILMGDAGSRSLGLFIAIAMLKSGAPIMYLLVSIVLIVDGGLGLFKVSFIKVFKKNPMPNIITPVHDQCKKKSGWVNTQVVYRFSIIQIIFSIIAIYLCIK